MKIAGLLVSLEALENGEVELLPLDVSADQLATAVSSEGRERPVIKGPLSGLLKLTLTDGHLRIKGDFAVRVEIPCDRCLNETETDLSGRVDEVLALAGPGYKADIDDDSIDGEIEINNGEIDLTELMAELFWLAWPFRFICREDCAGLCARCGADLNNGPCACRDHDWN